MEDDPRESHGAVLRYNGLRAQTETDRARADLRPQTRNRGKLKEREVR